MGETPSIGAMIVATAITGAALYAGYSIASFYGSLGSSKSSTMAAAIKKKDEKFPDLAKMNRSSSSSSSVVKEAESGSDMRGYKLTSDGRKTSYFNNELSEEARALIGDITPKRIDGGSAAQAASAAAPPPNTVNSISNSSSSSPGRSSGSSWNSAGTFEEKDVSVAARGLLKARLLRVGPLTSAAGSAVTVAVESVNDIRGEVMHIFSRGKNKYIYDLTVDLGFTIKGPAGSETTRGRIVLADITADANSDDVTVGFEGVSGPNKDRRKGGVFARTVGLSLPDAAQGSLLHCVRLELAAFLRDLKTKYEGPH